MKQGLKLAVLAGSAEARVIAQRAQSAGAQVRAVLSEPPRGANPMPVPYTMVDPAAPGALADLCAGADAVVDASHGFDAALSLQGCAAARAADLPFLCYRRPPWQLLARPDWHSVATLAAALPLIGEGSRVFAATGWAGLAELAGFRGARLFLRQTTPHDRPPPYDFVKLAFGTPPFSQADEEALFRDLRIDTLICRNLGGQASRPKVDAAAALGIGAILIDRPPLPKGAAQVDSVDAVLDWLAAF